MGVNGETGEAAPRATGRDTLSGVVILVVEDDEPTREALQLFFAYYGADVVGASSAAEALGNFERAHPALLDSDIDLPGENGFTLIGRIRARDRARGRYTPAIAMSGFAPFDLGLRARDAGFDDFVPKPIDASALLATATALVCRR